MYVHNGENKHNVPFHLITNKISFKVMCFQPNPSFPTTKQNEQKVWTKQLGIYGFKII